MLNRLLIIITVVPVVFPLHILESPSPVEVLEGSPATLICRTSSSYEVVTWYKDGSILHQEEGRCLLLPDGSLFFLNALLEDTGDYHCSVSDMKTIARSKHARLSVVSEKEEKEVFSDKNDEKEVHTLEFSIPHKLKPPKNINVELLLDGTGVVKWSKAESSTGYLVLVMADNIPVSNISVDSSVDTVQLHNLSPSHHYSVEIATVYEGSISEPSKRHSLYLSSPLTTSPSSRIPTQLWVIAFLVVIMMILIIILVVSIIVFKTRSAARRDSVSETESGKRIIHYQPTYTTKGPVREYNDRLYPTDHIYDYATSDQCRFSTKSSNSDYSQEYPFLQSQQPLL